MSTTPSEKLAAKQFSGITWNQFFTAVALVLAGALVTLFIFSAKSPATFTPLDLIGFTLSVALSGSSIVLAIVAIHLGRASEQALIQRSDESIRLQNEIFLKTTEALQRIESSTDVTEKRIEDIIAGRAGAIAEKVAASTKIERISVDQQALKQSVRDAIETTVSSESPSGRPRVAVTQARERIRIRAEVEEKYQAEHAALLAIVSSVDGVRTLKAGHGDIDASNQEKFDAIFLTPTGKKVYLCTFRRTTSIQIIEAFIFSVASDLRSGDVHAMFIVIFTNKDSSQVMKENIGNLLPEVARKIHILFGEDAQSLGQKVVAELQG